MADRPELTVAWVQGLAYNKAAPASVVRRIMTVRDRLCYPTLWLSQVDHAGDVLAEIAAHPDVVFVVRWLGILTWMSRRGLIDDPDDTVRLRLSLREDLSDQERQAIPYIVPEGYHQTPPWFEGLEDNPAALIRLASSPHVLIRRSVAVSGTCPSRPSLRSSTTRPGGRSRAAGLGSESLERGCRGP